jgi:hypothetical protein
MRLAKVQQVLQVIALLRRERLVLSHLQRPAFTLGLRLLASPAFLLLRLAVVKVVYADILVVASRVMVVGVVY